MLGHWTVVRTGVRMSGPLRLNRCAICGARRPEGRWALGLDATLGGDRLAWLCERCEAAPGWARRFVDAVRERYPGAELLATTAYADRLVQAPLVLPRPGISGLEGGRG